MSEWLQAIKEIYTDFKNKTKNMEKGYKTIPFDITRLNDKGARVVTKNGYPVRILCTDRKGDYPIAAIICYPDAESLESYSIDGKDLIGGSSDVDLVIQIPEEKRRMTNKEVSWWLRDRPEEHRELRYFDDPDTFIYSYHEYKSSYEDVEVCDFVEIRSNGGEWHEPLINEKEE